MDKQVTRMRWIEEKTDMYKKVIKLKFPKNDIVAIIFVHSSYFNPKLDGKIYVGIGIERKYENGTETYFIDYNRECKTIEQAKQWVKDWITKSGLDTLKTKSEQKPEEQDNV